MEKICPRCNTKYPEYSTYCDYDGFSLSPSSSQEDELIGKVLGGKYRLEQFLGSDGEGKVYYGKELNTNVDVTIKVLSNSIMSDAKYAEILKRRANMALKLNHPNIIRIKDYGTHEDSSGYKFYLVLNLMQAHTLEDLINQQEPIDLYKINIILDQIAKALDYIHSQNYVHGAIEASHIFFFNYGSSNEQIKLNCPGGKGLPSPSSMSPEQAQGIDIDKRSDIYSLGCLLYRAITKNHVFKAASSMATMLKHIHAAPIPIPDITPQIPSEIDKVVLKALSKHPKDRQQSASQLAREFSAAVTSTLKLQKHQYKPTPSVLEHGSMITNEGIEFGHYFAFIGQDYYKKPHVKSILKLLNLKEQPSSSIASLLGEEELDLIGQKIKQYSIKSLKLSSLVTDKMLYQHKKDTVTVVAAIIGQPIHNLEMALSCNGLSLDKYSTHLIHTDEQSSLAILKLNNLAPGQYTVQLVEFENCQVNFTVAEYKLAPLTADFIKSSYKTEVFNFTAKLESYGLALKDQVRVELIEENKVIDHKIVNTSKNGQISHSFKLEGKGPFFLNFIACQDPSKTATLPIVGSREQERKNLVISQLGRKVEASLLPLKDSVFVRGLYLQKTDYTNTPFIIEDEITAEAQIKARTEAELVKIVVVDPITCKIKEYEFKQVKPKQIFKVPIPKPFGLVAIGAFLKDKPWEAWSVLLHPCSLEINITAPKTVEPGTEAEITITTNRPDTTLAAFLLIKDRRLISIDTLENGLANSIKSNIETNTGKLEIGNPQDFQYKATPLIPSMVVVPLCHISDYDIERSAIALASVGSIASGPGPFVPIAAPPSKIPPNSSITSSKSPSGSKGGASQPPGDDWSSWEGEYDPNSIRNEFPEVIYSEILPIKGKTTVKVKVGDSIAEHIIEAFVTDGLDWRVAKFHFNTTKELFAEVDVPPYVHPEDFVVGRVIVRANSEIFCLSVSIDGEELPFWLDGQQISSNTPIKRKSAELSFPLRPGLLRVEAKDLSNGKSDVSERRIDQPGKFENLVKRPRLLESGQSLTTLDSQIKSITILPGIDRPLAAVANGTASYEHCCCEQTAAKIMASVAIFLMADKQSERDKAEAIIIAGIEREKSMWLPGKGLKPYPHSPNQVTEQWSQMACRHLYHLNSLKDIVPERKQLTKAIKEGLKIVDDLIQVHKIQFLPSNINSFEDAYQVITKDKNRKPQAIKYLVERIGQNPLYSFQNKDNSKRSGDIRRESCFAAAALVATGQKENIKLALPIINWVFSQITSQGRFYSTYDSIALIILLSELEKSGLLSGKFAKLKVNDQIMSLEEALNFPNRIESLEVINGLVTVEVMSIELEDWDNFSCAIPISVSVISNEKKISMESLKVAQSFELVVRLDEGYAEGDLLHICLPASLSYLFGGGQLKKFQLDFQGSNELRVPLTALAPTLKMNNPTNTGLLSRLWSLLSFDESYSYGQEHWSLAVCNMFDEKRSASLGSLRVSVHS